ncbi:MAG: hypothetical protein O2782_10900 [bacterium]|nr:hypothetical protein [bacterium]
MSKIASWITVTVMALHVAAGAAMPLAIEVYDTPNDAGGSLTLTWSRAVAGASSWYSVYVATAADGPFRLATTTATPGLKSAEPGLFGYDDDNDGYHVLHISDYATGNGEERESLKDGTTYFVRLGVQTAAGEVVGAALSATPRGNLFNTSKWNNLILGIGLSFVILLYISMARRKDLFIRRIAGLEALDEALGRATEMGKSVLFVHGLKGMDQIPTIAAVSILGRVAQRTARFDTDLRVANVDPVVMSVSQEVVKEAYLQEGRPDAYRPDSVFMAATEQFSYAAAVEGIMVRDRPAAHILMGYFYAESLLLTETGSTTGAIQIAGTDSYTQLPFFVTTCDYTLMGEELYAASAYLSREPKLLGSLKGQDVGKALIIGLLVVGTVLATFGVDTLTHLFAAL